MNQVGNPKRAEIVIFNRVDEVEDAYNTEQGFIFLDTQYRGQMIMPPNVITITEMTDNVLRSTVQAITELADTAKLPDQEIEVTIEPSLTRSPFNILVIDDAVRNRNSAYETLSGHHVSTTHSFEKAMEMLDKRIFDVVLTDLYLPMSSRSMGAKFRLGQQVPYGLLIKTRAAQRGARLVAVVTDAGHHDDAISAALSYFQREVAREENAITMLMRAHMVKGAKDWGYALQKLQEEEG